MKKVLAGTDFSHHAGHAIRVASALANDLGADLHVVHVHDSMLTGSDVDESFLVKAESQQAEKLHKQISEILGDRKVHTAILRGEPVGAMLQYAGQIDAGYIVVGKVGRSAIQDLLLGSVAKGILKHSPIPVVSVHA